MQLRQAHETGVRWVSRMLAAGTKPNLAKLTLARQIAAIVLSMWKHGETYDPKRQAVVTDKT